MSENFHKIQYLDTLRSIAMLGVIINHVTTPVIKMTFGRNMEYWWIGNIIQSTFRFDIAIFLMLSGATILGKEYKLVDYFKKRFVKVLLPFLFWLVAYWVYRWLILSPKTQPRDFYSILNWATDLFRNEGVSKHFWYIYMILILYLFIPFLGKIIRSIKNSNLPILLIIWILIIFLFRIKIINVESWPYILLKAKDYLLYSGFLVLGYYLVNLTFEAKKYRILSAVIYLSTIIFTAIFTYIASENDHGLNLSFYTSYSLNTIIQAIAFVLLLKDTTFSNRMLIWLSETIGNYSYGIYLVHIMIIGILFNNGIYWKIANPLISIPLLTITVLIISFAIIWTLRKLPLGKYISG